jgi:hypothetical protein
MNKWIILLTSSVSNINNKIKDSEYRKKLYKQQITRWLNETNLDIFIVESSGYDFPEINHERLHKIIFKFDREYPSSSQYEAQSILYALENIKNTPQFNNCTHILKVTGRYFLKDIEKVLNNTHQDLDLYLQKHRDTNKKWQHTEYYGIKKELFLPFLQKFKDIGLVEHILFEFSNQHSGCFIGPFPNNVRRGGDNMLLKYL